MRETFDEAEFIAALREVERTGGVQIDELIDEIEWKIGMVRESRRRGNRE